MATFRADVKKELAEGTTTSKPSTGAKKLYHVQIGAYSVKKNADKQLAKAKKAGFKDAFVKYE
ncbi:SPOR domain-containing protein [Geobacillus sp. 47C-IIb]|nr:SPOR domain-containing protein [Geobacillus sp. 47C-IIb]